MSKPSKSAKADSHRIRPYLYAITNNYKIQIIYRNLPKMEWTQWWIQRNQKGSNCVYWVFIGRFQCLGYVAPARSYYTSFDSPGRGDSHGTNHFAVAPFNENHHVTT